MVASRPATRRGAVAHSIRGQVLMRAPGAAALRVSDVLRSQLAWSRRLRHRPRRRLSAASISISFEGPHLTS